MTKQRRLPGDGLARRGFLAGVAAGGSLLAGCATGRGDAGDATRGGGGEGSSGAGRSGPVSILAAGSLQLALSRGLAGAVDVPVRVEAHGSAAAARLVATGSKDPEVVSLADPDLFSSILSVPWYAVFASNAVVLAYNAETAGGRRVAEAAPDTWYEPLLAEEATLGRTDPDQDPLGYRTLFVLELASRYYDDAPALRERLPERSHRYPETSLLSRFETGAIDAAMVYRSMAEERGYDYVSLPDRIDLSAGEHVEDWYATVSYTLPEGTTIAGDRIEYATTARRPRPAVRTAFDAHVTGAYLTEHGFVVPDDLPRFEGDVPDGLAG